MQHIARIALAGATALTLLATTTTAAAAPTPPQLALPEPTGPLPVGQTQLHLVDHARQDPWVPQHDRELMVTTWYPATSTTGPHAQYVTPGESRHILQGLQDIPDVPDDILSTTRTHARTHARPLTNALPLVLLSPGFSHPRAALTGLAEDLASRGYAVAAIDHNHESRAIEFPDGHITTCRACETDFDGPKITRNRARDISFVLDQLPRETGIQPTRTAMVGHSIGGASTTRALHDDPRLHAAINIDGTFFPPLTTDIDRPYMLLGNQQHRPEGIDTSWDSSWPHLTGWKRWLTVDDTSHSSFTDFSILSEQLGAGLPNEPLTGHRTAEITRDYVAAFLDQHLRGLPRPLLRAPSPHYPEVRFENPNPQ